MNAVHDSLHVEDGNATAVRFQTSYGPASVVRSVAEIDPALRAGAYSGNCKDLRYHAVAAETLCGQFDHRFLLLENIATGEVAIQPVFIAIQDVAGGLPRQLRALVGQSNPTS